MEIHSRAGLRNETPRLGTVLSSPLAAMIAPRCGDSATDQAARGRREGGGSGKVLCHYPDGSVCSWPGA